MVLFFGMGAKNCTIKKIKRSWPALHERGPEGSSSSSTRPLLLRMPGNNSPRLRSMNYRHPFHAGNFGDLLKRSVLVAVLRHMHRKDKPMLLLDTHASRGMFELTSEEATRSPEQLHGRLPSTRADLSISARRVLAALPLRNVCDRAHAHVSQHTHINAKIKMISGADS